MTTTKTRPATRQMTITGKQHPNTYIGLVVSLTTSEHRNLIGRVESVEGLRPVVRFADGRWAYGERTMRVLRDQSTPLSTVPAQPTRSDVWW